jgi:hypothetical protein
MANDHRGNPIGNPATSHGGHASQPLSKRRPFPLESTRRIAEMRGRAANNPNVKLIAGDPDNYDIDADLPIYGSVTHVSERDWPDHWENRGFRKYNAEVANYDYGEIRELPPTYTRAGAMFGARLAARKWSKTGDQLGNTTINPVKLAVQAVGNIREEREWRKKDEARKVQDEYRRQQDELDYDY